MKDFSWALWWLLGYWTAKNVIDDNPLPYICFGAYIFITIVINCIYVYNNRCKLY